MTPGKLGRGSVLALALAWAPGLSGCGDPVAATLQQADVLVARGDVPEAAALLRTLLARLDARAKNDAGPREAASTAVAVQVRLAELGAGPLHDPAQAVADYAQAVRRDPMGAGVVPAQRQLADLYAGPLGRPEHAVSALRAAAATRGTRREGAQVREQLWAILLAMGNHEAAHAEAQGIVERWPQAPEATRARLTMGRVDFLAGRYPRAAATLEAIAETTGDPVARAQAQVEAGNCYQEQGDPGRALASYHAALATHPNPALVQVQIARVRDRLHHMAPRDSILNASRPSRHVASWLPRPTPQELGIGGP